MPEPKPTPDRTSPRGIDPFTPPAINQPPELAQLTKYEVIGKLGEGGMGVVYKVREKSVDRVVALKMIRGAANSQAIERFNREVRLAARLSHPGIVPIYDIGAAGQVPYFTMAFVDGGSLAAKLKLGGPLPPGRAAELLCQVARAVEYAHQHGVIHRDLKPDNVLIDAQGNARLTDFGLAKDQNKSPDQSSLTATGSVLGTPSYMAPEQARGKAKTAGEPADVYALGGILYACLTARPPFVGESTYDIIIKVVQDAPTAPSALVPSVPPGLEAICLKCLRKKPADRFRSAAAVAKAVEDWLDRSRTEDSGSQVVTPGTIGLRGGHDGKFPGAFTARFAAARFAAGGTCPPDPRGSDS